jgi:L-fuconate dehydratase
MKCITITRVETQDRRFPLHQGAGSDAVHAVVAYGYAVTNLMTDSDHKGCGSVLTLGTGTEVVCQLISHLADAITGMDIESVMSDFGAVARGMADHPELRWLGPHKGAVHLALASLTNACFDLWAKARGVPLWKLLLDLSPEEVVSLLDLSYLEHTLTKQDALNILCEHRATRMSRQCILRSGYPGYDTSVGWFQYDDSKVRDKAREALDLGFRAFKLKVGSADYNRDIRRAFMLRELVGPECRLMLDANQQWTFPEAVKMSDALRDVDPFWIEEPTHPDDIAAHTRLSRFWAPTRIALGEHVPNRVMFQNFMESGAVYFVQPDCTRLAGVSEFLTVSLLARKYELPVVPHVGDMGQVHQHLVLFNHIALGHEAMFLEHIPHLRRYFVHPACVENGVYCTPQEPGSSAELLQEPE